MNEITTLAQLAVDHEYYCVVNGTREIFETWSDFYDEWNDADMDYNLVVRWDIIRDKDVRRGSIDRIGYYMDVMIIHQRFGKLVSKTILNISESDVPQIIDFLRPRAKYLANLWAPILLIRTK